MQSRLFTLIHKTKTAVLSSSTKLISRQLAVLQQPKSLIHTQTPTLSTTTLASMLPVQAAKPAPTTLKTYQPKQHLYHAQQEPRLTVWQQNAINLLLQEQKNCLPTPIYFLCTIDGVDIFAKDERKQPTGSHKHRLARSLFLHALRKGLINENTKLVEASSGGTARSEAYFAKLLKIPYTAVVSKGTPQNKLDAIIAKSGFIIECEPGQDKAVAATLSNQADWYFIDQFANAGLATDKENNIASELTQQFKHHNIAMPRYVVCGAGTGGTSAILGGYFQQHGFDNTDVIVGDPENSAFTLAFNTGDMTAVTGISSRIGGIGRPRVEPAFDLTKIKEVMAVPDAASIAASHFLNNIFKLHTGASTGTNLFVCLELIERMRINNEKGSVLMFIFDEGNLYNNTYYNPAWLKSQKLNILPYLQRLNDMFGNYSNKKDILAKAFPQPSIIHRFRPIPTQEVVLFDKKPVIEDKLVSDNNSLKPHELGCLPRPGTRLG
jgi:cysteine synthase A